MKSVLTAPGATDLTWMPNGASSRDRLSLQPSSAHFVAWYSESNGCAVRPAIDVVVMIVSLRFSRKCRRNACVVRMAPRRFVSM